MRKNLRNDEMKYRTLDFSKCRYLGEIHDIIRDEFELPDWYGANLDALWDSVTGIMYTPADITVCKKVANKELEPIVAEIIELLYEAKEEYDEIIIHVTE